MAFDIDEENGNRSAIPGQEAWRNRYETASFRGVEFFIDSATNTVGRKQSVHEFPGRDETFTEDLGRKERVYNFDAYILGDDYFDHREQLIQALEEEGPGKLIHPYRGEFEVVVAGTPSITETTKEGRIARFTLSFREQRVIELTKKVVNTQVDNYEKRQTLFDSLRDTFEELYDLSQQPIPVVDAVLAALDEAADLLLSAKKIVNSVAEFQQKISNIKGKLIQIAFDAQDLYNEFADAVSFGSDVFSKLFPATPGNAIEQITEFESIIDTINLSNAESIPGGSVDLVNSMVINQSITSLAGLISVADYASKSEAEETRDRAFLLLNDLQANPSTSDLVFAAISDMKEAIQNDIDVRLEDLGEIFDYTVQDESIPSIVLANSIYGNLDKEQDIIDRNKIQNPFFVTSPTPLKIVLDV